MACADNPDAPRVLFMDRSALLRKVMSRHLAEAGYAVVTVADSREAQACLAQDPLPCIVFLEATEANMDVEGFLDLRDGDARLCAVAVVLSTEHSWLYKRPMPPPYPYIVRPYSPDELIEHIRKYGTNARERA